MSLLAIIPARGGSKGILKKNIYKINGIPLIAYSINAALQVEKIDKLIVSTDDEEIAEISKEYGASLAPKRNKILADDKSPIIDTVLDLIDKYPNYNEIIVLQPTSPLRNSKDISGIINFKKEMKCPSVVSICKVAKVPELMFRLNNSNKLLPIINNNNNYQRRQDYKEAYQLNGALYIADKNWIQKTKSLIQNDTLGYEMPLDRSPDIDTELDLKWAEFLNKQNN